MCMLPPKATQLFVVFFGWKLCWGQLGPVKLACLTSRIKCKHGQTKKCEDRAQVSILHTPIKNVYFGPQQNLKDLGVSGDYIRCICLGIEENPNSYSPWSLVKVKYIKFILNEFLDVLQYWLDLILDWIPFTLSWKIHIKILQFRKWYMEFHEMQKYSWLEYQ